MQATPQRIEDLPDVFDVHTAAHILKCSPGTVYSMCRSGELPCRRVRRLVRIRKSDFIEWLEAIER